MQLLELLAELQVVGPEERRAPVAEGGVELEDGLFLGAEFLMIQLRKAERCVGVDFELHKIIKFPRRVSYKF